MNTIKTHKMLKNLWCGKNSMTPDFRISEESLLDSGALQRLVLVQVAAEWRKWPLSKFTWVEYLWCSTLCRWNDNWSKSTVFVPSGAFDSCESISCWISKPIEPPASRTPGKFSWSTPLDALKTLDVKFFNVLLLKDSVEFWLIWRVECWLSRKIRGWFTVTCAEFVDKFCDWDDRRERALLEFDSADTSWTENGTFLWRKKFESEGPNSWWIGSLPTKPTWRKFGKINGFLDKSVAKYEEPA